MVPSDSRLLLKVFGHDSTRDGESRKFDQASQLVELDLRPTRVPCPVHDPLDKDASAENYAKHFVPQPAWNHLPLVHDFESRPTSCWSVGKLAESLFGATTREAWNTEVSGISESTLNEHGGLNPGSHEYTDMPHCQANEYEQNQCRCPT